MTLSVTNHLGHPGDLSSVAVSPDGSLCAYSGKDGTIRLWDLNENCLCSYTLEGHNTATVLCFNPSRFWLCATVGAAIKVWVSYITIAFIALIGK